MAWVEFTADFRWHPTAVSTIAYKAGMKLNVKRACADAAIAKGVAVEVIPPRQAEGAGNSENVTSSEPTD